MTNEQEGVTKFVLDHLREQLEHIDITALNHWRQILVKLDLVGCDRQRYDGYGFGNLSQRTKRGFVITGSQTGKKTTLDVGDYAEVTSVKFEHNKITAKGMTPPSSESLTHGAVYSCCDEVNFVFHVHCPEIWRTADRLELPVTAAEVAYGTIAMANAVTDLMATNTGIFTMAGHEDGVIAYGTESIAVGLLLIETLFKAKLIDGRDE